MIYVNEDRSEPEEYKIKEIWVNGEKADITEICGIKRKELLGFPTEEMIEVKVILE